MMKKLLLVVLLSFSFSYPFQVILHFEANKRVWSFTKAVCSDYNLPPMVRVVAMPATGIIQHMTTDALFNEGNLGTYQVLRGAVKLGTLIMIEPTQDQQELFWVAFWGLFPDLWDKGLGRNDFHWYKPDSYLLSADREAEEVLEDWIVFDSVAKKFVVRKVPAGTIFAVEIPIGG